MKRKTIIKLVALILVIVSALTYVYIKNKDKVSVDEMDNQRIESIKSYDARQNDVQVVEVTPDEITNGKPLTLKNRAEFLKKFENVDIGIVIANNLIPSVVKYFDIINEDCKEDKVEKYYAANKDAMNNIFGIENSDEFQPIYKAIKSAGKLKNVEITLDGLEVLGNGADFNLKLNGENGESTLYVKSVVSDTKTGKVSFFVEGKK